MTTGTPIAGLVRRGVAVLLAAVGLAVIAAGALPAEQPAPRRELVLLNWAQYVDPGVIAEFETAFNAKVREIIFETDDARDQMVQETEGVGFDLALVNDVMVAPYARRGWIAPIEAERAPNLKHIDPRWTSAFQAAKTHGVPYFWGTLGIAYRSDKISKPVTSWMDLFRPAEDLRGRIVMIYDVRDTIGMALKALGYSVNTAEPGALAAAEDLLVKQRPFVHSYSYVTLAEESGIVTGDFVMAMMYNGDVVFLQKIDPNIQYVVPREGTNLWTDYWTIMAKSANKDLALQFLNFINEPRNAARMAEYVSFATPNRAAEQFLPKSFLENPLIYPPASVLERSEPYRPLPVDVVKTRNSIFAHVVR